MATVLVPHSVTQTSANLWLAVTDSSARPASLTLNIHGVPPVPVPQAGWRAVTGAGELPAGERRTWVQVVTVNGLQQGTAFVAEAAGSIARFATLPATLPRPSDPPFTILLGSCYAAHNDMGVGRMIDVITQTVRPSLKILCGDQVYLDQNGVIPGIPLMAASMARELHRKYLRNWTDAGGFHKLLREGATWFTPDDHEYWNNFPNPATLHPVTFSGNRREVLTRIAKSLYEDFQSDDPARVGSSRQFRVGALDFFIADTRTNRGRGNTTLQTDADHRAMISWIENLQSPGVLVVGQPVFDKPAGFLGAVLADRTLPNYESQYPALANALRRARHSVLILTGDVHYGRVAETAGLSEPIIREVIASPSALVAGAHADTKPAPEMFPAIATGAPQVMTNTIPESRRAGDQFATLEFTAASGVVHTTVRQWYVREPTRTPVPIRFRLI